MEPLPDPLPEAPPEQPNVSPKPAPAPSPDPAPAPEPEPPPQADVKALLASYAGEVKAAILRHREYPAVAERLGHEGAVKVAFTIDSQGRLARLDVSSGSGYNSLDEAALEAVRNTAPFAPLPAELSRDSLALSITLNFSLR